ncbi:hypothetical protein TEA_021649 [Camellia sinensis var. sinensis]|uniref:Uncharacterized protein n=1 Tax=Camellia sinensis var. sinensis TaxID=542762 RepID=A0A4S4EHW0_CAMSN|nr:hypothetical protein TEA_021649 [Camellia sinensis var. sinensis]
MFDITGKLSEYHRKFARVSSEYSERYRKSPKCLEFARCPIALLCSEAGKCENVIGMLSRCPIALPYLMPVNVRDIVGCPIAPLCSVTILASNWQGNLNTIKADAKGSKEEIYTSMVKYFVKRGKPYIWVPEKDFHNVVSIPLVL